MSVDIIFKCNYCGFSWYGIRNNNCQKCGVDLK